MHFDESWATLLFAARAMNVRINAVMNEFVGYKMQKPQGNGQDVNNQLFEENQELKTQISELEKQLKQKNGSFSRFNFVLHQKALLKS